MKWKIQPSSDALAEFCRRWHIKQLALFGSVLEETFGPGSDIDVLVSFDEGARHTLLDLDDMERELGEMFGRKVDLVSRRGVEASENLARRNSILSSAQIIYGA